MSTRRFTTDKQRQAARRNGARSRGPVTEAGKRKASANNQRHLLATGSIEHILNDPAFQETHAAYRQDLAPATPAEDALVAAIAVARWRIAHAIALESAALDHYVRQAAAESASGRTRRESLALGFKQALADGVPFEAYHRYEARDQRLWREAYAALLESRCRAANKKLPFEPGPALTSSPSMAKPVEIPQANVMAANATQRIPFEPDHDPTLGKSAA